MLKARTRWQLAVYDEAISDKLAVECGISPLLARLLVIRGIDTPERAKHFLHVSVDQFHSPFLLDGMEKSVARIKQAIERQEPICIYGDYDADGVSSTSLMVHLMREMGATFDYYIPNRFKEGYGLNNEALRYIHSTGCKLVITVDTGISAVEQVAYGQSLGLDIIVTDHHEPPEVIPQAFAVINPKKPGCPYPFEMLAGVGVAFKLAHALLGEPPLHLLDLAAIGTIADLVPLVDENRVIASLGLARLNHTRNVGLQALLRVCGLEETELSAGHVGFAIGPRINAGGRLETAEAAVKLLTVTDADEANTYAKQLDALNTERQELVQQMTEEAVAMVLADYPPESNAVLVLAKEGWNVGVVGIVASRIVEQFYRPTIVLGIDPEKGTAKGSARSIAGFDMYQALTACKELLPHYGGHTMAAGMTLPVDNLPLFRDKLQEVARACLSAEDFTPITKVDVQVELDSFGLDEVTELEALAPFGMGNPTPLLLLTDVQTSDLRKIGRDDAHLKCALVGNGKSIDAIGFKLAHVTDQMTTNARLNVVGELSVNEWNGRRKPQLTIRDLAIPHRQVFDWRGSKEKLRKWQSLQTDSAVLTVTFERDNYALLKELSAASETAAAAATAEPAAGEASSGTAGADRRTVPGFALYCAQADGADDDMAPYEASKVVVLYDLPKSKAALAQVLTRLPQIERIYCLFGDGQLGFDSMNFPSREQFKQLYAMLRQFPTLQKQHVQALAKKQQLRVDVLARMLAVFCELGFLHEFDTYFEIVPNPPKNALDNSRLYTNWMEEAELATELLLSSHDTLRTYLNRWVEPHSSLEEKEDGF